MRLPFFPMLSAAFVASCHRAPSGVDLFAKTVTLVDQYLNTNAVGAEAAMLQLELYTRESEKAGYRAGLGEPDLDQMYAAVYSRLYLVQRFLGKNQAAAQHYQLAAEYWAKVCAARGLTQLTVEQMRDQVEGVDRHLVGPQWKTQK